MNHIQGYNQLRILCRTKKYGEAHEVAEDLLTALEDSGCTYGWFKIPFTNSEPLDDILKHINKHFTGQVGTYTRSERITTDLKAASTEQSRYAAEFGGVDADGIEDDG